MAYRALTVIHDGAVRHWIADGARRRFMVPRGYHFTQRRKQ